MTREQQTYETLRQWVTVGRFLPGERLKLRDVAAELGTGLMPVRAALQRLSAEGALTYSPNRGVAVPRLSRAEFDDVLQTRLLLEGRNEMLNQPYLLIAPAICIALVLLAFTFIGDGLRDALDPRQKNS